MADDLRIYGRGAGGDASPQGRREHLARFRRAHKPGEVVRGVFLRLELASPGTAWVNFEGAILLAGLPPDLAELAVLIARGQGAGATPTGVREADFPLRGGDVCYFAVESLEPEPVLRMLELPNNQSQKSDEEVAAALRREEENMQWRSLLRLPLTQLAALYSQKRNALDAALHARLWRAEDLARPFPASLPEALLDFDNVALSGYPALAGEEQTGPESNGAADGQAAGSERSPVPEAWRVAQGRYTAFVAGDDEAKALHGPMQLYRAALLENLRPAGVLAFFFAPWLCPQAQSLELAFYSQGGQKNTGSAAPPATGPGAAMAGIRYKLQGSLGPQGAVTAHILELSGIAGHEGTLLAQLRPGDPDLLRFLLSLALPAAQSGFSRKA